MIWVSHPTGNVFVRALLEALEGAGSSPVFHTTLGLAADSFLLQMPGSVGRELRRRAYELPAKRLVTKPVREIARLVAGRCGLSWLARHEAGLVSIDAVGQDLDRAVAARLRACDGGEKPDLVYGYEDWCADTFAAAQELGIRCCYELPIAYWETSRKLLREEAERLPEWKSTLGGDRDSARKLERKSRELESADLVICPSRFVLDSLPQRVRDSKPCQVAEFGSPAAAAQVCETPVCKPANGAGRLRVLFAGSLSQRKGLADAFAAMKLLHRDDIELVVMGTPAAPMSFYRSQYPDFTYEPTRPHAQVLELMRTCDVLVLPSIVEGRALVQQEAMSCSLPIVVTANAGGEDLVQEGATGFLVPIRSPEKIAEKLAWLADHREAVPQMGEAARVKAQEYTWSRYGSGILSALELLAPDETRRPHV